MSDSLRLLDEALRIGKEELEALRVGEVELAEEYSSQRDALSKQALAIHDTSDKNLYARFSALQTLQGQLVEEARNLKMRIQQGLNRSRQEHHRMKGYGLSVRQAMGSV